MSARRERPTGTSSRPRSPDAGATAPAPLPPERVAGGGLLLSFATHLVARLLETRSMAATVLSAVMAEWGARRLGVTWTDDAPTDAPQRSLARRILVGAGLGAGAIGAVAAFASATGAVVFDRTNLAVSVLVMGLVTALFDAMREEMLLRGVVLRALGASPSPLFRVVATGVVSAAATLGTPDVAPERVVVGLVLGLFFGALWVRDRGAWMAWAAHAAWLFGQGLLLQGGMFRVHLAPTRWAGGAHGMLDGRAAVVAVLPLATWAVVWAALAAPRTKTP